MESRSTTFWCLAACSKLCLWGSSIANSSIAEVCFFSLVIIAHCENMPWWIGLGCFQFGEIIDNANVLEQIFDLHFCQQHILASNCQWRVGIKWQVMILNALLLWEGGLNSWQWGEMAFDPKAYVLGQLETALRDHNCPLHHGLEPLGVPMASSQALGEPFSVSQKETLQNSSWEGSQGQKDPWDPFSS
jgi:hypothetical protein